MKKKIIIILLLVTNYLYADLVDVYRNNGIDAVKKELELKLQTKTYWDKYLKNFDVRYGYYESKKYVIVAKKISKKLELYKNEDNQILKILSKSIIVGEKSGDKELEGDLKTPIGAYNLTNKLTKVDQFYGPMALVTNYPNSFDKSLNKKGHGIWIHGMPLNEDRENFTKGCIALDNENLKILDKNINFNESVLLISDKEISITSKDDISNILSFIYSWTDSWRNSDLSSYLSYYDESFKRSNGETYKKFKIHKTHVFSRKEKKNIHFSNINIMPYPNSLNKNMYKIIMDQDYKTKSYSYQGQKELYIEIKNEKILILSEA